jgi:hypothetical protein
VYGGLPLRRLVGQQRRHPWSPSLLHLTATDHIHDLGVNYAPLHPARMVFVKLFEFYAVFFQRRRRVLRSGKPPHASP